MLPKSNIFSLLPGIAGLFFGRILLELWAIQNQTAVSPWVIWVVAGGSFSLGVIIYWAAKKWLKFNLSLKNLWPFFFFIFYILLPSLSFKYALFTLMGVMILFIFIHSQKRLRSTRAAVPKIAAGVLAAGFFILYARTLATDILTADNGEFQWVSTLLGVLHPPGFPLYTVLAYGMSNLPIGPSPAFRISLFSALTSSATLFFVFLTTQYLNKSNWAAATAVLILGTAPTFWAQATTANIRSLTGLFVAVTLYLLVQLPHLSESRFIRLLTTAVFLTALGIFHHPSLLFFGVIYLIYVLWLDASLIWPSRRWVRFGLVVLAALLPWVYLPLRANSGAPGARPGLASLDGFLNHALARGFSGDFFFFIQPAVFIERLRVMGQVLTFQFSIWVLLGALAGLFFLFRSNAKWALLLAGSFALHTILTATYRAPQTVEYMLPTYIPIAICLGMLVGTLQCMPKTALGTQFVVPVFTALILTSAIFQGVSNWPTFAALHQSTDTRATIDSLLDQSEPNGLLLTDWHWYTPLRYAQEVEGQRPDLEIRFVAPEGDSYGQVWADRIMAGMENGRSVSATHFDPEAYQQLPPAYPLDAGFAYLRQPLRQMPPRFSPNTPLSFSNFQLLGSHLPSEQVVIGEPILIEIAWQSDEPLNLFLHAIGTDGRLYAQHDQLATPQPDGISILQFQLTLHPGAAPGSYALLLGNGSDRMQIGEITAAAAPFPPVTQNPLYLPQVGSDRRLIGYDFDHTLPTRTRLYLHWQNENGYYSSVIDDQAIAALELPAFIGGWGRRMEWTPPQPRKRSNYVPFGRHIVWLGSNNLPQLSPHKTHIARLRFATSQPILRDTAVSVRLIGFQPDNFTWAWWDLDDAVPAMGAIPTLKWIAGSRVVDPHFVTTAETAVSGQTIGTTLRMYDTFTNQTIPILDARITAEYQWVPMAFSTIE